jgi:hypothetical protein
MITINNKFQKQANDYSDEFFGIQVSPWDAARRKLLLAGNNTY